MKAAATFSRRGQRGNALIEFAIGAFVLCFIFMGTFQFGYAFYVYNNLLEAVDSGAKYAALRAYDSSTNTPSSAFKTAVQNMVVYGQPTAGTEAVAPGLQPTQVNLAVTFNNGVPSQMQVSLQNYPLNAVMQTFNLSKPQVTYSYMGVYSPP